MFSAGLIGIEGQPFAHEGELFARRGIARVLEHDHPRRFVAAARDAENRTHALGGHLLFVERVVGEAELLRDGFGVRGHVGGGHLVGRRERQRACEVDGLADHTPAFGAGTQRVRIEGMLARARDEREFVEHDRLVGFGAIRGRIDRSGERALDDEGGCLAGVVARLERQRERDRRDVTLPEMAHGRSGIARKRSDLEFFTLAQPDDQHPLGAGTGRMDERRFARCAADLARGQDVRDRSVRFGVGGFRGAVETAIRENRDDQDPRAQRGGSSR